jgi:hypothetical protein
MPNTFTLLTFVVNNRKLFLDNAELCTINTRNSHNLHLPLPHLTKFQKGVHYAGVWIFNHLPTPIKNSQRNRGFQKNTKKMPN